MSKTTLEVLIEARWLIEKPENWCQGRTAQSAGGKDLTGNALHPSAVAFCAYGAVVKAVNSYVHDADAMDALSEAMGVERWNVDLFNDSHTHAEVLAAFDKAIEAERAKASP